MKMGKTMSKKVESTKADRQEDQGLSKLLIKPGKPGSKMTPMRELSRNHKGVFAKPFPKTDPKTY